MLYDALDQIITTVNPRVARYRNLGQIADEDRANMLSDHSTFSQEQRDFLASKNVPSVLEYWLVMAQYTLALIDVFGYDPTSSKSRKASAEIGRLFQMIKIADDHVGKDLGRPDRITKLLGFLEFSHKDSEDADVTFLQQEYRALRPEFQSGLQRLVQREFKRVEAVNDMERYAARGEVGSMAGRLQQAIIDRYVHLHGKQRNFIEENARAAAHFDDWQDFHEDRKTPFGYQQLSRLALWNSFRAEMSRAEDFLSSQESRKYFAFKLLGGLYQARKYLDK